MQKTQKKIPRKPVDGVLLLDKPLGLSSNQALQRIKWLLKAKKAGHTGNLDPLATGVLPLCFGEATKFASQGLDADKTYVTRIQLGETRDTGDAEGEALECFPLPEMNETRLQQLLADFTGPQQQVPPMYSALKHQGRKLYELARAGENVERPPRDIVLHQLKLLEFTPDSLTLEVHCSKGTYIRVLGEDLARALGSGGYLSSLRRIASGAEDASQLVDLPTLEAAFEQQGEAGILAYMRPVDHLVRHLPICQLNEADAEKLLQGQAVKLLDEVAAIGENVRLYASGSDFIGLAQVRSEADKLLLQPLKMRSVAAQG
ncbi:tRNA pseudouridine(55) synthase TruB [Marinospirillum alkaliphilum]|uniref:tRNA pseudouridine synthase B n=1 Tax=Marinospirillum alkaliphilum DSM 21637 TaxID=1122209 RepID=A0A1K1Y703_9GAMM|nr:tRNA pseudouridine(55) synthase TruB [Marinospirillum alkaliphilum]SFX57101.1 tRNA pseudouridine synthase B [Marinospirillum alkaliphilum DSM 21637]